MEIPYSFNSEAYDLIYKVRRSVEDTPTRFKMIRIADYVRETEWTAYKAEQRAKTLAEAKKKSATTRARNADPFGFKRMQESGVW